METGKMHALIARRGDYKTWHILHLLLALFTAGMWIPVWIICSVSNGIERRRIDRKLNGMD